MDRKWGPGTYFRNESEYLRYRDTWEGAIDTMNRREREEKEALAEEIADKIHQGEPIGVIVARDVGKKAMILRILQKLAGKYIDDGDPVRASIALREAKKLI